jgi:Zn-dependent peptidase ImmA (M78 family)
MKIPNSLHVKGRKYSVRYKWNLRDDNGHPCDGLCDREKKIIYLDHSLKGDKKDRAFVHELLHALFTELNISGTILNEDNEEHIVANLEEFFV